MTRTDDLPFAAEFPPATREQWLKLVDGVLKGAPFDKKLVSRTYDGLKIEPLYPRDPAAAAIPGRALAEPWQVMQRVEHPDPAAANAQALHDLANGATGLTLVFAGAIGARGFGLSASEETLARVLADIRLDAIALELDVALNAERVPHDMAAILERRGIAPAATSIRFGIDPLGALAVAGAATQSWPETAPLFAARIAQLVAQGFKGPFAVADGRVIHDAGGSEAQELAFVLAVAVAYLRALEAHGMPLDAARHMIFFRLAADADQFLTMAKFRALRKLWARIAQACGLVPTAAFISAETAWRMMTRRDPWVNMLRTTVAAVAAGLAGANALTVLPFTAALGLPDGFARRIARNTQLILLEESNLAKVTDPAAGAGGIEDVTRQLCAAAWSQFQEIEKAGGAWGALERGLIQRQVATVRAAREKAVALRRDALTGTSEFPNIYEAPIEVLSTAAVAPGPDAPGPVQVAPLAPLRLAQPFELLRDASDRWLARTGTRPKVFLANLGTLAEFTARATFAKNFFEAGGIEAVTNDGFPSRGDMMTAFQASGARLACLCASDAVYVREAVAAAEALKAAGALHIYLAGRPHELETALAHAGVGTFIYVGCDVLGTLRAAHDLLAIRGEGP